MTLADVRNQGFCNWFTLGFRKSNLFIHPFGTCKFDEIEADYIIKDIKRR